MRFSLALLVWVVPYPVHAGIPDIVCQELKVLFVEPISLSARSYESRTLYRFKGGNLFLSSPDQSEYLYNKVVEVEPNRYTSAHKTFIFDSDDFRSPLAVHTYKDEVRVSRLSCKAQE
jgi:hypothetical protein